MQYDTILIEPLRDMVVRVADFVPTLLLSFAILIVGYFLAHAVEKVLNKFLKMLEFDAVADKMGIGHILRKGGVKQHIHNCFAAFFEQGGSKR